MNKIFYLLLLTISLFLGSCDSATEEIPAKGRFVKDVENKDGSVTQKEYLDGILKSEFGIKNKRRHGVGLVYYPNGKLHSRYNYADGLLQGESIWYYKNGKVYDVNTYVNHKKHGLRKTYYENGKIKSEQEYKNNLPQNGLKEYRINGELIKQPQFIVTTKNRVVYENKYFIYCSLSDKSQKVKYNKIVVFGKDECPIAIKVNKGIGELMFPVFPGSFLMEDILVRAETKTAFGNTLILDKKIRVAVDNN